MKTLKDYLGEEVKDPAVLKAFKDAGIPAVSYGFIARTAAQDKKIDVFLSVLKKSGFDYRDLGNGTYQFFKGRTVVGIRPKNKMKFQSILDIDEA